MMRKSVIIALLGAIFLANAFAQALPHVQSIDPVWRGKWEGAVGDPDSRVPFTLWVYEKCAFIDIPSKELWRFPLSGINSTGTQIAFALSDSIVFRATLSGARAEGLAETEAGNLPFFIVYSALQPDPQKTVRFDTGNGILEGTLEIPYGAKVDLTLVIILGGAGQATDRDGNNYNSRGKSDAIKMFAEALRIGGFASFRYDKRGSGVAHWMVESEEDIRFDAYVKDAAACIRSFRNDRRFSRIIIAGYTEGALVAAVAANIEKVDGYMALCATGKTMAEEMAAAFEANLTGDVKTQALSILASLKSGKTISSVPPELNATLRPSIQKYLISIFAFDIKKQLAALKCPIALIHGDYDIQVTLDDFTLLANSAPSAKLYIIPKMNHVLKEVPQDYAENYKSFSDPSYPIPFALIQAVRDFLKSPIPGGAL